jgi:hypothetical protein
MTMPGRICPLDYRYGPAAIATAPPFEAETLYVVGGLYGNLAALDEIERMAADEAGPVTIIFNGDFNWFNAGDAGFAEINRRVLAHRATAGNVEAELVRADAEAGCGCAYPASVDQAIVERSNAIHARLRETALRHPDILDLLAALPRVARCRVGRATVGIVHGDAESLAGWGFDVVALDRPGADDALAAQLRAAVVDVFACSHTCLPVFRLVRSRARFTSLAWLKSQQAQIGRVVQPRHRVVPRDDARGLLRGLRHRHRAVAARRRGDDAGRRALFRARAGSLLVSFASTLGATLAFLRRAFCCATGCRRASAHRLARSTRASRATAPSICSRCAWCRRSRSS